MTLLTTGNATAVVWMGAMCVGVVCLWLLLVPFEAILLFFRKRRADRERRDRRGE